MHACFNGYQVLSFENNMQVHFRCFALFHGECDRIYIEFGKSLLVIQDELFLTQICNAHLFNSEEGFFSSLMWKVAVYLFCYIDLTLLWFVTGLKLQFFFYCLRPEKKNIYMG